MTSMWRRTMLYLGLGPDEEYEDYNLESGAAIARPEPVAAAASPVSRSRPAGREPSPEPATVRPVQAPSQEANRTRPPAVRPVPAAANAKPSVVAPTSFNHAQEVADRFKSNQPVIVNLQGLDRDLSRRLIDFASGVCYGLGGHMERVASQVYLLTPSNVEVSAEERRRLEERGYDA
jgi:cell division inhibitor SepF